MPDGDYEITPEGMEPMALSRQDPGCDSRLRSAICANRCGDVALRRGDRDIS